MIIIASLKDIICTGVIRCLNKIYASEFIGKLTGNADTATNSDKLDGYHGSSSQSANTYVLRDSNGYVFTNNSGFFAGANLGGSVITVDDKIKVDLNSYGYKQLIQAISVIR